MTGIEGNLTGRPMHPIRSARPSNRVYSQILQVNALRREGYTLKEVATLLDIDEGTACLRTYGIANDNNVFQKQENNMMYRLMHKGACCHIDYWFLGIGDKYDGTLGTLKFGTKFRRELKENNDKLVRREIRNIIPKQRKFKILGDKLNAKKN